MPDGLTRHLLVTPSHQRHHEFVPVLADEDSPYFAGGIIQLSVPLFAGGSVSASTRQAARQLSQAQYELDAQTAATLVDLRKQFNLNNSAATCRSRLDFNECHLDYSPAAKLISWPGLRHT